MGVQTNWDDINIETISNDYAMNRYDHMAMPLVNLEYITENHGEHSDNSIQNYTSDNLLLNEDQTDENYEQIGNDDDQMNTSDDLDENDDYGTWFCNVCPCRFKSLSNLKKHYEYFIRKIREKKNTGISNRYHKKFKIRYHQEMIKNICKK